MNKKKGAIEDTNDINGPLSQMAFRILYRVYELPEKFRNSVLDKGSEEWYSWFMENCDPEQRAEIEYHRSLDDLFGK